jgi:helix-turn-helix protein
MATITPLKTTPHTRIENSIIDEYLPQIGTYGFTIYIVIKRHLNQKTGDCFPSYQTIARKIGIDRGTVIRYVKKLKALNLLSPSLRFKEDGSPSSNQYNFSAAPTPGNQDEPKEGSGTEPPPLVVEDNSSSSTKPPEQSLLPNKKKRTIAEIDLMPTEKQKSCPHPRSEIVFLADSITICHHCYGLLDENLRLTVDEDKSHENHHAEGEDTSEAA